MVAITRSLIALRESRNIDATGRVSIGSKVPRYDRGITLAGAEFARSALVGRHPQRSRMACSIVIFATRLDGRLVVPRT